MVEEEPVTRLRPVAGALMLLMLLPGCASTFRSSQPLRLSEVSGKGDAARRASMRLIAEGLESDLRSRPAHALSH